jgi:hypothetical protein
MLFKSKLDGLSMHSKEGGLFIRVMKSWLYEWISMYN